MLIEIDPDVKAVVEFMQCHIECTNLVPVANAVRDLAPLLWGKHEPEKIIPLRLAGNAFTLRDELPRQPIASELALGVRGDACDDFAGASDALASKMLPTHR